MLGMRSSGLRLDSLKATSSSTAPLAPGNEGYWCQRVIGVSSFFTEKRTDTNNPAYPPRPLIFPCARLTVPFPAAQMSVQVGQRRGRSIGLWRHLGFVGSR